jgi:protocatechuate 3,4-dioxygenase beta subunit
MMKMNKKYSIVAIALIALMCAGTAYAMIKIWSPPVNVNLQYTVTMNMTYTEYRKGEGMALCATVLDGSNAPVQGITVDFYASTDGGATYGYVGTSDASNTSGDASFLWTEAGAYNYWFKAYCAI